MVQFVKLRLSGFKSFVDPTELVIEPGTTGIVGPNGCGKSNLVEALRWAMGETSAKQMRGSEMDDVIFGGSASRPARNIAEVTLQLDNRDRTAPAAFNDFEELEVMRRIERDKGSNYRVNGKEVRARDVQLLYADSATGAHSTAIVSQGRIGAIINAKPTQRRGLLEEAAGITGLHSRRHEAELRLRAAETNLERLDDVIGTLETQHQGLKRQARQATRYRNIADHLRRSEATLMHIDALAAKAAVTEARAHFTTCENGVGELSGLAAQAASAQAETVAMLPPLRQAEAEAAAALQRLLLERDGLDREAAAVTEARRAADQRLAQIDGDLQRAVALGSDASEAEARLEHERADLAAAAAGESASQEAAVAKRDALAATVGERDEALTALAQQVASDEAGRSALERRIGELRERIDRLQDRRTQAEAERGRLQAENDRQAELDAAGVAQSEAEAALERARIEAEAAETALGEARARESAARQALQERQTAHARLEAEIAALAALLEPDEGDIWPPVVDTVAVEPGYESALGAALGDDLSASTDEAAPVHWQTLPALTAPAPLPAGSEPLSARVRGPAALARRLSQIGVVRDAAAGARLQADLMPGQRLVTPEGDLWRWDGFLAKADAPTAAAQRLAQKNRLADLREALHDSQRGFAAAGEAVEECQAAAEARAAAERGTREAVRAAFARLDRAREARGAIAQAQAATHSRIAALDETLERLRGDQQESETALAAARGDLETLPDLSAARERVSSLRAELAERRSVLAEAEATVLRLAREAEARAERLLAIQRERESWQRRAREAAQHGEELDQRRRQVAEEISVLAARPGEIAARRDALTERIEAAERHRRSAADALAEGETRLAQADRAAKSADQALAEARENRVRAEAAVAQAEQALETLVARARERLDCTLGDLPAQAELAPDQDLPQRDQVQAKVDRLIRERENMGPVNLRAEAEASELEERITGLQTERGDLVAAIARLRQGISSLNREGRERLLAAFEQVNQHFSDLFERLFGGGRAHLALTEAEDPLEAGIEIMASPPGKRLQVMSLLSGGEQALTALSLLFAVFLTNPAPICVLDEVDAPLDDSNVDRFCALVDELAHSLQTRFMIITHHRLTMARVDRLFGVTMAERGVSQLVSVDLGGAESIRKSA